VGIASRGELIGEACETAIAVDTAARNRKA